MDQPKISIIVNVFNMQREAMRTLTSLSSRYQQNVKEDDYEVLVVENGSTEKLNPDSISNLGNNFIYHDLTNPHPSPAYAINFGISRAKGDLVGIMIDGACMLTPGVLGMAFKAFKAFDNPIVMTRYFYLGPGDQNTTMNMGYNQEEEDKLLEKIEWPKDGYRLIEIGTPLKTLRNKVTWFSKMFESNCLILKKSTFEQIGGCDERFNIPGGGFLNLDLYRESARLPDTELVQILGEGTFHQFHGGTTTNTSSEEQKTKIERYKEQYEQIRGTAFTMSEKPIYYIGHMPTLHATKCMNP